MKDVVVSYPDDLELAVHLTAEEFAAQILLMAALKMFELGKLSSGKAAELAGISRIEFLEACARYRVPAFNYTAEELPSELQADLKTIQSLHP